MGEVTTSTYELVRSADGRYKINGDGNAVILTTAPQKTRPTSVAVASLRRLTRSLSFDSEAVAAESRTEHSPSAPRSTRAIDTSFLKRFEEFHHQKPLSPVTPKFGCSSAKSLASGAVPEFQFFATDQNDDVKVDFLATPDLPDRSLGDPASGHKPPPPSPSTPLSPPVLFQDGSTSFGDEATAAIDELNTPSPLGARQNHASSKSCDCVMGLAMREVQSDPLLPKEKLADAMESPEALATTVQTTTSTSLRDRLVTPAAKAPPLPRSQTWPKLHVSKTEEEEEEVIKRFTVTHKLGKTPSLLCCVSMPDPPAARSTDTASRWWLLLLFTAFLLSSSSGFLSNGPRLFSRAGLSPTTSTVVHSPHNIPTDHDEGGAQFAHFTNFRANADPDSAAEAHKLASAPVAPVAFDSAGAWHMGMSSAALVEALTERDASEPHHDYQRLTSQTIAHSVLVSAARESGGPNGQSLSPLQEKARRDRITAKWALREVSRKSKKSILPQDGWQCNEYGCTLRDETADGVTGELVFTALSIAPLSEPQKLVARSILGNIVYNTTSELMRGDNLQLGDLMKAWLHDPANVPRALLRHALIPALTHMMVHGVTQAWWSMAAQAATLPEILPDSTEVAAALQHCAESVACLSVLQDSLLP